MNIKINTICFIFLFLFLISAVSASDFENETLSTIKQPDSNQTLCKLSVENSEKTTKAISDTGVINANKQTTQEKVYLTAPDVKMHYKDGTTFKVTLKDKNKKAISNAKIKIAINGVTYNKVTDKKGTTSINLNLKSGTYTVLTTFDGTAKYLKQSTKSTVTIKSTIKCSDFTKYYKNTASYYATFYDQKGKLLKNTAVKIKLNSKTYSIKTNNKGVGKLSIDLKPGKYSISVTNSKTSETITKTVTINSLIEANNLAVNESDTAKFSVKILNSYGKASPNKKVTFKVNDATYTKTTDKNGIATLNLKLDVGKYTITTEFSGLKSTNTITVNKLIKTSKFLHTILIPDYVNVTTSYVFKNSQYSLKTGPNGIIRLPKNEIFTVQIGDKTYLFSTSKIEGIDSIVIGYNNYLIPLDGSGIKSNYNKNNLKDNGITISKINGYTQIDYQSNTSNNVELFGVYADKYLTNSETITYMQNDKITAKVNFQTQSFDETGLKYNLAKYYQKSINDFNTKSYDEITNHNTASIKFTNTNIPVEFSYYGRSIAGYVSKETIITKFFVDGKKELEKTETISYGVSNKYRKSLGFEMLQSYSIINEKITANILKNWVSINSNYLSRFGVMNVYGMHLASLETTWLADEIADSHSKEFGVSWKRGHTLTILGGINLEDTYLNILNADMGMDVSGNEKNAILFRLINSINLPNLEDYSLSEVAWRYQDNTTNSQDNIFAAIANKKFSIAQLEEMIYIFSEDETNSAMVLNSTSGVSNMILSQGNATYKGSKIFTAGDCCSVGIMPKDIIAGIKITLNSFTKGIEEISNSLDKLHPLSVLAYYGIKLVLERTLQGASATITSLFTLMVAIQNVGTMYRDKIVNEEDWHALMDTVTFTRPGYLQGKKVYNIPNNKGGYDYIEVKINGDLSLDRDNAVYISDGSVRKLTKEETYQYFSDEYWTPISLPTQYWDDSWQGIVT